MQERYADRIVRENLEKEEQRRRWEECLRLSRQQEEESLHRERLQTRTSRSNVTRPSEPAGGSPLFAITLVFLAGFMIFTCAHRGSALATKKKSTVPRVEPHRPRHRKHHTHPPKDLRSSH